MWDSKPKKITSATLSLEVKIAPHNKRILFIVGAIFASRPSIALVIFFGLESHIGKIHFLFMPYKG